MAKVKAQKPKGAGKRKTVEETGGATGVAETTAAKAVPAELSPAAAMLSVTESSPRPQAAVTPETPAASSEATLHLESSLEIKDVEHIHRTMLALLDGGSAITVDITHVGTMDTAGAQLLLAFQNEAVKRSVSIQFSGRSSAFTRALTALGLSGAIQHVIFRD